MTVPTSADGARVPLSRPLAPGRAVVGGLLVVAAVALTVIATRDPAVDRRQAHVVAAGDLGPGQLLTDEDLATALVELDEGIASASFTDPIAVRGAVVVNPVAAGELVQRSDLAAATHTDRADQAAVEVTFPVQRSRAPRSLQPGERVTVLATHTAAGGSTTSVSVRDAVVVHFDAGDSGLTAGDEAVLTLALASTADHVGVVHDTQVAALTVIRDNSSIVSVDSGGDHE